MISASKSAFGIKKWDIVAYLVGDNLARLVRCGRWLADLRKIEADAVHRLWVKILLGGTPTYIDENTGHAVEPDTDCELEDGVFDAELNFCNPLWKLQLSRASDDISRPLEIVILMLGNPPSFVAPHNENAARSLAECERGSADHGERRSGAHQ